MESPQKTIASSTPTPPLPVTSSKDPSVEALRVALQKAQAEAAATKEENRRLKIQIAQLEKLAISPKELVPAAERGDTIVVAAALRNPLTDPNVADKCGKVALVEAACSGCISVVQLLIADERVNPNIADRGGNTTLMLVGALNNELPEEILREILGILLGSSRLDPNIDNPYGEFGTALSTAAAWGHDSVVKILLADRRVAPENHGGVLGYTALMAAAFRGRASTTSILLADGRIDPNTTDAKGRGFTALTLAAEDGHASVVQLLLADGRVDNPNSTTEHGHTALTLAAADGHAPVVKLLLADKRVDPNISSRSGDTALSFAAGNNCVSVVKLLLADKRVDPNIASQSGSTALSLAAVEGLPTIVKLLLCDSRMSRTRPMNGRATYDTALRSLKEDRKRLFRGLVRIVVLFGRLRLHAAETAYAPGGAGFAAAARHFSAAAAAD
jgi:ankyrin repeat protein